MRKQTQKKRKFSSFSKSIVLFGVGGWGEERIMLIKFIILYSLELCVLDMYSNCVLFVQRKLFSKSQTQALCLPTFFWEFFFWGFFFTQFCLYAQYFKILKSLSLLFLEFGAKKREVLHQKSRLLEFVLLTTRFHLVACQSGWLCSLCLWVVIVNIAVSSVLIHRVYPSLIYINEENNV